MKKQKFLWILIENLTSRNRFVTKIWFYCQIHLISWEKWKFVRERTSELLEMILIIEIIIITIFRNECVPRVIGAEAWCCSKYILAPITCRKKSLSSPRLRGHEMKNLSLPEPIRPSFTRGFNALGSFRDLHFPSRGISSCRPTRIRSSRLQRFARMLVFIDWRSFVRNSWFSWRETEFQANEIPGKESAKKRVSIHKVEFLGKTSKEERASGKDKFWAIIMTRSISFGREIKPLDLSLIYAYGRSSMFCRITCDRLP